MDRAILDADEILQHASPVVHQAAHEVQPYGHLIRVPIALTESACKESVENLNQLLADSITLRDLYKKHHWHVSGPTFYQLHLLFDKHCAEQTKLIDSIAERIQLLGGVSIAMAPDVAETTIIPRSPRAASPFRCKFLDYFTPTKSYSKRLARWRAWRPSMRTMAPTIYWLAM